MLASGKGNSDLFAEGPPTDEHESSFASPKKIADQIPNTDDRSSQSRLAIGSVAPKIVAQRVALGTPIIKGTWPHKIAKGLEVSLDGKTYILGVHGNVTALNENWSLRPQAALKAGVYEVSTVVTTFDGAIINDATFYELVVTSPSKKEFYDRIIGDQEILGGDFVK